MSRRSPRPARHAGFTLSEVMTAAAITVILTALVLGLMLAMSKQYRSTEIKNSVSDDYREMTRVLVEQGNMANGFYVYPSFAAADRAGAANRVGVGKSGDLVLFVFFSIKDIKTSPNLQGVSRVMGAFREKSTNAPSAIRWFDSARHNWGQTFNAAAPVVIPLDLTGIEALLPPASFAAKCPVLANHTRGASTAGGAVSSLFYNNDKSVHITGFITRSGTDSANAPIAAGVAQSQTAFTLTISPRSQ